MISESNARDHWRVRARRHKLQKQAVQRSLVHLLLTPSLPCTVRLVRLGVRLLDSDNLQGAFKAVRDSVGALLVPGKAAGQADNDPRITWEYAQEKGKNQIRIEIYE